MLFLLNDRIVDVPLPEMHLERRWQRIGCGSPYAMRPHEVIDFVRSRLSVDAHMTLDTARDLASLIIARTGANSLIIRHRLDGSCEPMLRLIPVPVLEVFARGTGRNGMSPTYGGERSIVAH